jgi:glycerate-2-kinase
MRAFQGDHPLPTERNTRATKAIIELLNTATEKDLVLFLVSGGGSTLLCQSESLTCEQEAVVLQCLFNAGAAIQDINTLRKHLSLARGGYLAKYAYPAQVLSLVFSDVPGNDLSFVASGPTVKDETAKADAERILEHYQVRELRGFSAIELLETPKEERYFKNVENILFLSNDTALHAMEEKAKELGLKAVIQTTTLVGEAKQVGESIAKALHQQSSCALLYGGETTVAVENSGKGGRSLELCLSALRFLEHGELIFAFASDGLDNTEAAGVLCDILTKEKVREKGLDLMEYLEGNRSFEFFEKTGDLVFTGLTGSNVSDLIIAIKE